MNLSLPVNQTRQCPLVISKVTKWKWKMCLLRHCFDFERVRHATWLTLVAHMHSCTPTLTSPIADTVGIADSVGKNHCISIADTLSLKIHDEILLHKQ